MRRTIMSLGAGAAALALIAVQPATAATSRLEVTGKATVVDTTGVSGPANTTYDTNFDLLFTVNHSTPGLTYIHGATFPFTALNYYLGDDGANPVRGSIDFDNGYGFSAGFNFGPPDGHSSGQAAQGLLDPAAGLGDGGAVVYTAETRLTDSVLDLDFLMELGIISPSNFGHTGVSFTQPWTYTLTGGDTVLYGDGTYRIDAFTAQALPAKLTFSLRPETLTFTTDLTAGVPEPATWALMIAGFGGMGWALRRRRLAVAA
jgi:hypothetical protein